MRFVRDREAVGQVLALLVAGLLFIGVIGILLYAGTQTASQDDDLGDATGHVRSESLADLLVSSPGIGWEGDVDDLQRLGLWGANDTLDPAHLALMRGGTFAATDNGLLDYDEAVIALGLDDNVDFHIRITPIALAPALESYLDGTRVAYIGDWVSLDDVAIPLGTVEQMIGDANDAVNTTMNILTEQERAALASLGVDFNDTVYMDTAWPIAAVDLPWPLSDLPLVDLLGITLLDGDVYPDYKQYLNGVLPGRLDQYDVLVVGSQVDHNSLTSNVVKNAIRDWVLDGGALIALGSDSQNYQWLQPLFQVGTTTVNGGAFALDPQHPLLHEPNELDWTGYDNHDLGWDIKDKGNGAHYDDFQHVIVEDGEDVLAVSLDGAFGDGRIFLTTYRPKEIADQLGLLEGQAMLENMFLYDDRSHLFLDFGPTVPQDQSVSVAVRHSSVDDFDLGQVPLRIEVWTWGGS